MFLECGSKVYFQHIAFAQTLLNIVYHSHWCVLVGTHAGTHLFSIDCRHGFVVLLQDSLLYPLNQQSCRSAAHTYCRPKPRQ